MVRNREELRQEAQAWLAQASEDLSSRFNDFIETQGVEPRELAQVLDISEQVLNEILRGDLTHVTAETLIKLFIANDLAVDIVPVGQTPIGQFGSRPAPLGGMMPPPMMGGMPPRGNAPIPPRGGFGRRAPQNTTMTTTQDPFNGREPFAVDVPQSQPRDAHGRFMPRNARLNARPTTERVVRPANAIAEKREATPYDSMTAEQIKNIIQRNLWASEIDLAHATREELIDFLINKENQFAEQSRHREAPRAEQAHRTEQAHRPAVSRAEQARLHAVPRNEQVEVRPQGNVSEENPFAGLINAMFAAAENDPRLAEQIRKFAPHN